MIPFKVSYTFRRVLGVSLLRSLVGAILDELEWRNTKRRWKREIAIWEKIKENGKGVKGNIATIKLEVKNDNNSKKD